MRGRLGVLTWGVALFLTLPCSLLAQGIQTPSETLETVLSLVQDNPYVSAKHAQVLSAFLATAVDQAAITPDEALKLFEAVGWTELTSEDAVGFAVRALELALIAVTAEGTPYDEVLAKLSEMAESGELDPLASETGSANALPGLATALLHSTENLTPELLAEIEGAVVSGIPPGQVIRTVKSLSGASEEEASAALDDLQKEISEGTPPGQALGQGHSQNEEQNGEQAALGSADHGKPGDEEKIRRGPPPGRGKPEDEEDEGHGKGRGKKG